MEQRYEEGKVNVRSELVKFAICAAVMIFGFCLGGWGVLMMLYGPSLLSISLLASWAAILVVGYVVQPFKEPTV